MYWPLGAPRSYAQQLPLELSQSSVEGVDVAAHLNQDAQVDNEVGKVESKLDTNGEQDDSEKSHQDFQVEGRVNGVAKEAKNNADGGKILSLKVSPYGHLFATITSSSLTVWQTQVSTLDQDHSYIMLMKYSLQSLSPLSSDLHCQYNLTDQM